MSSRPHPFVIEGDCISLNCEEIAKAGIARARHEGAIIGSFVISEPGLQRAIAGKIDQAEAIRAGKRFGRGEGGTALVITDAIDGTRDDVPEAHMNAAQVAFGATDRPTLDKIRAVVRAVRAIDNAALDEALTTIAAEGGSSSDDYGDGFNAAIGIAMATLEQLGARDTRIAPARLQAAE